MDTVVAIVCVKCEEEWKSEMAHSLQVEVKVWGRVEMTLLSNRVGGNNINTSSFKFALSYFDHFPYNVEMLTADVSYDFSFIAGDAVLCFSGVFNYC